MKNSFDGLKFYSISTTVPFGLTSAIETTHTISPKILKTIIFEVTSAVIIVKRKLKNTKYVKTEVIFKFRNGIFRSAL